MEIKSEVILSGKETFVIPEFGSPVIEYVLREAKEIHKEDGVMIYLSSPCVIVGDLHGSLFDLFRILELNGKPSARNKYLFLGDLIDKGQFSFEVMMCVFILKILFPENVFVLRGDREFAEAKSCGEAFFDDVSTVYRTNDLKEKVYAVFDQLPLAALVDHSIFCVHAGIGPSFKEIAQLELLHKPKSVLEHSVFAELVWSDPCVLNELFSENRRRGRGSLFNYQATKNFLENNKLLMIVRGHEVKKRGVEAMFDGLLLTVSSSSQSEYDMCGVVYIRSKDQWEARRYRGFKSIRKIAYKCCTGKMRSGPSRKRRTSDDNPNISFLMKFAFRMRSKTKDVTTGGY